MSRRDGYRHGVPCWVAAVHPDPVAGAAFYTGLFGWEADTMDFGGFEATMWRLPGYRGGEPGQPVPADVVAVLLAQGDQGPDAPPASWSVDFWVTDADATAARAADRSGVLADPQGASFSVSRSPVPG